MTTETHDLARYTAEFKRLAELDDSEIGEKHVTALAEACAAQDRRAFVKAALAYRNHDACCRAVRLAGSARGPFERRALAITLGKMVEDLVTPEGLADGYVATLGAIWI